MWCYVGDRKGVYFESFRLHPDGQRFLLEVPVDEAASSITVVLNWTTELKR